MDHSQTSFGTLLGSLGALNAMPSPSKMGCDDVLMSHLAALENYRRDVPLTEQIHVLIIFALIFLGGPRGSPCCHPPLVGILVKTGLSFESTKREMCYVEVIAAIWHCGVMFTPPRLTFGVRH